MIQMHQLQTPGYIVISDFGIAVQVVTVREFGRSFIQGSCYYPNISRMKPNLNDLTK
jgi:hypothetical protein